MGLPRPAQHYARRPAQHSARLRAARGALLGLWLSLSLSLALGGCHSAPSGEEGGNVASTKPGATGGSAGGPAPKATASGKGTKSGKPGKSGKPSGKPGKSSPVAATPATKPRLNPTMSASVAMGVDILKALNADPGMAGHAISVGTGPGTVWLNGFVPQASQRALAEKIARREAPGAKVVNELKVGKPPAPSFAPAMSKAKPPKPPKPPKPAAPKTSSKAPPKTPPKAKPPAAAKEE